jgi:hypothetical protein
MATRKQELIHRLKWYKVDALMMWINFYMPIRDVFRGLWWKAWGHSPKDPEFHLSQIKASGPLMTKMCIVGTLFQIGDIYYGSKEKACMAKVMGLADRWRQLQYIPYDAFMAFHKASSYDMTNGQAMIDLFLTIEGIPPSVLEYRAGLSPDTLVIYQTILKMGAKDDRF